MFAPEKFETIALWLLGYGIEGIFAGFLVFFLIKFFLPGYLTEKGKNLATSEDIAEITKKIESVKSDYSVLLEQHRAKNQLRIAAIDKRLEVHQEAFVHWRGLMAKMHTDEIRAKVIECQNWWERNCLYLEPQARDAFSEAYHSAMSHRDMLDSGDGRLVRDNWDILMKAGQKIVEAVQLPGLTDAEIKELNERN